MTEKITEPGLYDMPDELYQADPCKDISLRSSIAWKLVGRGSTPAHAAYCCPRINETYEPPQKKYFHIGSAAHSLLFGDPTAFAIVHHDNYKSREAQKDREAIIRAGKVPLLEHEAATVRNMAKTARRQIQALIDAGTIERSPFDAEQSHKVMVWRDHGVLCRAQLDGLSIADGGIISEYKTEGQSASPELWPWQARKLGYIFRLAFYRRGLEALKMAFSPAFHFYVQETEPPHLLALHRVDDELIGIGDEEVKRALKIWRRCVETNKWPGYSLDGFDISPTERELLPAIGKNGAPDRSEHVSSDDIARSL